MKCYKLNEKLNLNANKVSLDKKIEKFFKQIQTVLQNYINKRIN